ncbi:phosphotransferase [Micromonospora craniellae]|uniref:Aminoglycoside phosphotransferase family protein n=1 Tax=Micromonospora craniellae TaxID=2294034 RepID=A0A372FSS2_9ACTN|nr:phosphotransferase [Micromonospora craniellae]QOC89665.1 phosphotransferase [Micromonospora craniellae]RFS43626.1 aminoglycoside phosphotransferase family protein [Micromonospora craniellae]
MIPDQVVAKLLAALTRATGVDVVRREPIQVWQLSGVERLHLRGGTTVVFKYATVPFTHEGRTLTYLAAHGVPVPLVHGSAIIENTLGMLMEDLGPAVREANEHDAAVAAAKLHAIGPSPGLVTLDESTLRTLPARSLAHVQQLGGSGILADARSLALLFHTLSRVAADRVAGANLAPFSTCHSELHPTSVHITEHGWHLLDLAKAFNGPSVLDLATWHGTRNAPDPPRLRSLLTRYVQAGGHPHALSDRAGLPAETWALAWHRIWAAETLLHQATIASDQPALGLIDVIRRQASTALELLKIR